MCESCRYENSLHSLNIKNEDYSLKQIFKINGLYLDDNLSTFNKDDISSVLFLDDSNILLTLKYEDFISVLEEVDHNSYYLDKMKLYNYCVDNNLLMWDYLYQSNNDLEIDKIEYVKDDKHLIITLQVWE